MYTKNTEKKVGASGVTAKGRRHDAHKNTRQTKKNKQSHKRCHMKRDSAVDVMGGELKTHRHKGVAGRRHHKPNQQITRSIHEKNKHKCETGHCHKRKQKSKSVKLTQKNAEYNDTLSRV